MKKPLLVSYFEPFGGDRLNSSAVVATQARGLLAAEDIIWVELPVSYEQSVRRVSELVATHDPVAVVALGQAAGRSALSFERQAQNLSNAAALDSDGHQGAGVILEGAPPTLATSLPIDLMARAASQSGCPVEFSDSAGGYVCNHLFYHLQLLGDRPSGFIHLPLVGEQAAEYPQGPTLASELLALGLSASLGILR